jgi:hypothetical protein
MLQLPFDTNHACFPNGLSVVVVVGAIVGTVLSGARYNSIFGEPPPTLEIASLVDVSRNFVLMSAALRFGSSCKSKAAAPATCGQAIDVPLIDL